MEKETIERVLESSNYIQFNGWINPDKYRYSRICSFTVRGVEYKIEWLLGCSRLYCGEMFLLFDNLRISDDKNELQFCRNGRICAVIPIEEYPEN